MLLIDEPNNVANEFVLPAPGQPATRFGAKWGNVIQRELANVALAKTGAALDQSGADRTQVLDAITWLIAQASGTIAAALAAEIVAREDADSAMAPHVTQLLEGKWLHTSAYDATYYQPPHGQSLLRADYPAAWTAIQASGMIAADHATWLANPTLWGPGVDGNHFDMMDLRAVFLRVDNGGKGGALGPVLGHFKGNQNAAHVHTNPDLGENTAANGIVSGGSHNGTYTAPDTNSEGGDEAVPDHVAATYVIRLK